MVSGDSAANLWDALRPAFAVITRYERIVNCPHTLLLRQLHRAWWCLWHTFLLMLPHGSLAKRVSSVAHERTSGYPNMVRSLVRVALSTMGAGPPLPPLPDLPTSGQFVRPSRNHWVAPGGSDSLAQSPRAGIASCDGTVAAWEPPNAYLSTRQHTVKHNRTPVLR